MTSLLTPILRVEAYQHRVMNFCGKLQWETNTKVIEELWEHYRKFHHKQIDQQVAEFHNETDSDEDKNSSLVNKVYDSD